MTPISATIITLNEEDRIRETLRALDFADEILVVDAGSTDRTREIAERAGARVLARAWTGYADQKNFAAGQATHDWILNVDADERPDPRLRTELIRWRASEPASGVTGYTVPRFTCYLGRWIRHSGWYPDRKLRLYDRRHSGWEGNHVHERVETRGRVSRLDGQLLHNPFRSLEEHYLRIDRYTALAARAEEERGRRFSPLRLAVGPPLHCLRSFVLRAGFLDGMSGLRIAYMGAWYVYLRETRISR